MSRRLQNQTARRRAAGVSNVTGRVALLLAVTAGALTAQTRTADRGERWEGDPAERRAALIEAWDARPGETEPRSGMGFDTWLAASGGPFATARLSVPVAAPGRWTSIGPYGIYGDNGFFGSLPQLDAGRVPTLAFHPTDRNILYIGTSAGGVWKSTNEGASWVPLTDGQCSLVIGAIAVDPVNPNILYVGTGEPSEATAGCGVLRSTDGGTTWSTFGQDVFVTNPSTSVVFYSIVVDQATAGSTTSTVLVAATNRGVFRSANSGQTWTLTTPALTFSDVVQHPTQPAVVYAARYGVSGSATPPGLWRSSDKGVNWTTVTTFTTDSSVRIEMAVSPARPGSVWLLSGRPDRRFGALYRWDDATNTRTSLDAAGVNASPVVANRNNFGGQSEYNLMIAVDPADANVIYVGGVRAFRSVNGGQTFSEIAPAIHCDWHAILVDPNDSRRILTGSDGGVFMSRDGAASFDALNSGLATTLHYAGLSLHPTDPTGVLTGMQDNGTVIARNGITAWNGINGGDGAYTATNPSDPNILYVSSQNGAMVRIDLSTNSARGITSGIDGNERRAFIAPFVIDPQRPNRLYFGATRVYRTITEGSSWTPISPDLTRGTGTIIALAVAPSDTNMIFAGTSDGNIRFTRDHGINWQAPSTSALPVRSVQDFAIDPADPNRVVVTFGSSGTSHVFLSKDGGQTWADINGSLPDVTTQAAAWGPGGRLFIGNMLGVYETTNEGATWTRHDGLPFIRITDLVYNARTNRLVAATYGRGIWSYTFGSATAVLRGDVNVDGQVNAADALLIQQALVGAQVSATAQLFPNADANCDGKMEVLDALLVLRHAVGNAPAGSCVGTRR